MVFSQIWVWWEKVLVMCLSNGEEESRGIWRVFMWRLWMNQSCFSLGFLSQKSLWKLSTFRGYKGLYIVGWERNVKSQFFLNRVVWRLDLVTRLSREFKLQANSMASLGLLSCSANNWHDSLAPLHAPYVCQLWRLASRESPASPTVSLYNLAQFWAFLHTLSLITFTWFPPKYRVTNC